MFKKIIIPAIIIGLIIKACKNKQTPLIGDKAPTFEAETTTGKINFPKDYIEHWVVLFSHPADFTPVCTTEFMSFETMREEFEKLNTKLLALSEDTIDAHKQWSKEINEKIDSNIIIKFPIIEDDGNIARKYGMLHPNVSDTKTVRAVFIIDDKSIIRAILYYPQTTGRNIEEIKRIIIALQSSDEFNIATPANWQKGDDVIVPMKKLNPEEEIEYPQKVDNINCKDWFLCFKEDPSKNQA